MEQLQNHKYLRNDIRGKQYQVIIIRVLILGRKQLFKNYDQNTTPWKEQTKSQHS